MVIETGKLKIIKQQMIETIPSNPEIRLEDISLICMG